MKRKSLFLLLFIVFVSFGFCKTVHGASGLLDFQKDLQDAADTGEQSLNSWIGGSDSVDPEKGDTGAIPGVINSLVTLIFPVVIEDPDAFLNSRIKTPGAILSASQIIPAFYNNPPASSVEYFADLGRNLGLVSPVYAQGIGFTALSPYLKIWKAFRNFAYLILIVISVVLGFMIMFRVKLSPQAVISIQSAIPRIVITVILITFSYAIAGLLIDLMYLLIGLFLQSLSFFGALDTAKVSAMREDYFSLDLMGTLSLLLGKGKSILWEVTTKTALGQSIMASAALGAILWLVALVPFVGGVTAAGATGTVGRVMQGLGQTSLGVSSAGFSIFILGLGIIIFGLLFQTIMMFVKAYITLLFNVILSPLILLFSALPSAKGSGGAGSWIKSILQQVLVFVVGVVVLTLGQLIMAIPSGWGPPFVGASPIIIKIAIGLGILIILPHVDEMVKSFLEGKGLQMAISTREFDSFSRNIEGMVTDKRRRPAMFNQGTEKLGKEARNLVKRQDIPGFGSAEELQELLEELRRRQAS